MRAQRFLLRATAVGGALLLQAGLVPIHIYTQTPPALTGYATSLEEGPMEGVVVSAKKDGSTISTRRLAVTTDGVPQFLAASGRHRRDRLRTTLGP